MLQTSALTRTVRAPKNLVQKFFIFVFTFFLLTFNFQLSNSFVFAADFNISANIPNSPIISQPTTINTSINFSNSYNDSIVDFEIYNDQGQKIFQKFFEHQNIIANQNLNLSFEWTPSILGTYRLKSGIFNNNWSQNYYWQDNMSSLGVVSQNTSDSSPKNFDISLTAAPPSYKLSISSPQNINDSIVDFEIYNDQGQKIFQKFFEHQNLTANTKTDYQIDWAGDASTKYFIKAGIFNNNWSQNYYWQDNLSSINNIPTPSPVTLQSTDTYKSEYWNLSENFSNPSFPQSAPDSTNSSAVINFNWGSNSPDSKIKSDNFIAAFTKQQNFEAGKYHFEVTSDDGVRLWIDNKILINQWNNQPATTFSVDTDLSNGSHTLKLEYFENTGDAVLKMNFSKIPDNNNTNLNIMPVQNNSFSNSSYTVGTDGKIYKNGQKINLSGVSWFGAEGGAHVPHGLWARNWQDMISQIKSVGFNAVRLPYCPATLKNVDVSTIEYNQNPDLKGLKSLDILDKIINELNNQHIYVLLDNHNPDCQAQSDLWYTGNYSETQWINDLAFLADRYKNLEYFIGLDIKNEPKGSATWGTGNFATDWNIAAEKAGKEILSKNPNLLIFVQGIENNPTCSDNSNGHWWGGNLEPQRCTPINPNFIPNNKLVFSPHVYGPDVFNQGYFNVSSFPQNLPPIWDTTFGFLRNQGKAVVIGEFGGKYGHGGDPKDITWQNALINYMASKGMTDNFYWSWNPNSGDTGGILKDDWTSVWQDKVDLLNKLK